jgi:ribonuclease HII
MDTYEKEVLNEGHRIVAGIDEAGRGPLAGPVVAAAVVFTPELMALGIKDSKKLSPGRRNTAALDIYLTAPATAVGVVWPEEVDRVNIHRATLKAMEKAVKALSIEPECLLIDGPFPVQGVRVAQRPIKSGDSKSVTIAAASIIAKTTRDSIMAAYHTLYPGYNFIKNKGYGTPEHISILRQSGPCPIHRKSFSFGFGPGPDRSTDDPENI